MVLSVHPNFNLVICLIYYYLQFIVIGKTKAKFKYILTKYLLQT